ncbi:PHD finger protein 21B isoform X2 [Sciurus carolinensis]|uniref:PHD finger protein 21B isoform X2 n=1 Tax=Sciurus carolinensis TaxID=30640 RepID=UPI001FB23885|nr:PHD finger protein 21B isoform X2 [Sciurus carolinensis]
MRRQPQNGDLKKQLHERQPRIAALSDKQTSGTTTAVPVTGPQVSSLQRLAGQGAAVLPQVRPKTLIPDSLPITPGRDRPPKQPPALQKATVVSIKNPSPALPTANNTVSHVPTPGGQPQALAEPTAIASPLSSAGVAYAIISTSPSNAAAIAPSTTVPVVSESLQVQPLLISADSKVIIIQPQVQTQPESSAEPRPPSEEPSQGAQATRKKKEDRPPSQESPEKIAFMVALGLVTTEHLEEIQSKRQERKRRSTANPAYSGLLETERKRLASSYLNNPLFLAARGLEERRGRALDWDAGHRSLLRHPQDSERRGEAEAAAAGQRAAERAPAAGGAGPAAGVRRAEVLGAQDQPAGPPEGHPVVTGPPAGPPETDTGRADAAGRRDSHQPCPAAGWALDQDPSSHHALCPPAPPGPQLTPGTCLHAHGKSLGPCSHDLGVLSALIHKHYDFQTKIKPDRKTTERREEPDQAGIPEPDGVEAESHPPRSEGMPGGQVGVTGWGTGSPHPQPSLAALAQPSP